MNFRLADPQKDASAVRQIYRKWIEESAVSFEEEVPLDSEIASRIENVLKEFPWIVCEVEGEGVVGYAYAQHHHSRGAYRWSVETSVYVRDDFHRKGVARELYERLFAILKRQGIVNALAGITIPHPSSLRFHEKFGFEPIGVYKKVGFKMGEWRDVVWLSKPLTNTDPTPLFLADCPNSVLFQSLANDSFVFLPHDRRL